MLSFCITHPHTPTRALLLDLLGFFPPASNFHLLVSCLKKKKKNLPWIHRSLPSVFVCSTNKLLSEITRSVARSLGCPVLFSSPEAERLLNLSVSNVLRWLNRLRCLTKCKSKFSFLPGAQIKFSSTFWLVERFKIITRYDLRWIQLFFSTRGLVVTSGSWPPELVAWELWFRRSF